MGRGGGRGATRVAYRSTCNDDCILWIPMSSIDCRNFFSKQITHLKFLSATEALVAL